MGVQARLNVVQSILQHILNEYSPSLDSLSKSDFLCSLNYSGAMTCFQFALKKKKKTCQETHTVVMQKMLSLRRVKSRVSAIIKTFSVKSIE